MLTALPGCVESGSHQVGAVAGAQLWPWSYRIAGATSSWPAVEVYESGSLLDVVSSTRLIAQVVRGARAARGPGGPRALAWGRLPLSGAVPSVEFSRGRHAQPRPTPQLLTITSWCWLAVADGPFRMVTVRYGGSCVRQRLRASKPCR